MTELLEWARIATLPADTDGATVHQDSVRVDLVYDRYVSTIKKNIFIILSYKELTAGK